MAPRSRPRVLAIGLDAAEPSLVRQLAERGDMPTLRKLFAEGSTGRVASPAHIGSLAVWPTFVSGADVWEHEKQSFWTWNPDRMQLERTTYESLQPFWRAPELAARSVGILDVPIAPAPVPLRGFEIAEWGAHYLWLGAMHVCPPSLAPRILAVAGEHPTRGLLDASATGRIEKDLLERCVDGTQRRGRLIELLIREEAPEFLLAVFGETHRASHIFWHTVPRAASRPAAPPPPDGPGLVDLFREVDRQLGRVLAVAGEDATVLVFSLHGMRDTRGVPLLLGPLLPAVGLATPAPEPMLSQVKRRVPRGLKQLYHRLVPAGVRLDLAIAGASPRYDWSRTRAFPLPTDQHGWIRINLKGREAAGIVEPSEYRGLCDDIERLLCDLRMEDGTPVVRGIVRTAPHYPTGVPRRLPDLVVHWAPAANAGPFRLRTPAIRCELEAPKLTGEHAPDGFWVFRSPRPGGPPAGRSIAAETLGRLLIDQLATS
jgi:predicted AlkP superfamily phosphohydrolase/phosphomutase